MPTVDLPLGTLHYRVAGPEPGSAPVAVFVHGFLVGGTLWDRVVERLAAAGVTCVVPDWPLGSHEVPASADADLSPSGVADGVRDLLEALDLDDAVLVGNDTGGAIVQLALRRDAARVGGVVLTNCDAFETFPPAFFVPLFRLARYRAAVWSLLQPTRWRVLRHSPLAFGRLLNAPRPAQLTAGWVRAPQHDVRIRRDINRFARAMRGDELVAAADWLDDVDVPVRIVWGTRDRCFTVDLGRRLAATFPHAALVEVSDATTFVPVDRPDAVADAIRQVIAERAGDPRPAS